MSTTEPPAEESETLLDPSSGEQVQAEPAPEPAEEPEAAPPEEVADDE
jgi:hypothetical protein